MKTYTITQAEIEALITAMGEVMRACRESNYGIAKEKAIDAFDQLVAIKTSGQEDKR